METEERQRCPEKACKAFSLDGLKYQGLCQTHFLDAFFRRTKDQEIPQKLASRFGEHLPENLLTAKTCSRIANGLVFLPVGIANLDGLLLHLCSVTVDSKSLNAWFVQMKAYQEAAAEELKLAIRLYRPKLDPSQMITHFTNPAARAFWLKFAQEEHCEENLLFWEATERYKTVSTEEAPACAAHIFKTFIDDNAEYEINVNVTEKKKLANAIEHWQDHDRTLFAALQGIYWAQLATGTFSNYNGSNLYHEAVLAMKNAQICETRKARVAGQNLRNITHPVPCTKLLSYLSFALLTLYTPHTVNMECLCPKIPCPVFSIRVFFLSNNLKRVFRPLLTHPDPRIAAVSLKFFFRLLQLYSNLERCLRFDELGIDGSSQLVHFAEINELACQSANSSDEVFNVLLEILTDKVVLPSLPSSWGRFTGECTRLASSVPPLSFLIDPEPDLTADPSEPRLRLTSSASPTRTPQGEGTSPSSRGMPEGSSGSTGSGSRGSNIFIRSGRSFSAAFIQKRDSALAQQPSNPDPGLIIVQDAEESINGEAREDESAPKPRSVTISCQNSPLDEVDVKTEDEWPRLRKDRYSHDPAPFITSTQNLLTNKTGSLERRVTMETMPFSHKRLASPERRVSGSSVPHLPRAASSNSLIVVPSTPSPDSSELLGSDDLSESSRKFSFAPSDSTPHEPLSRTSSAAFTASEEKMNEERPSTGARYEHVSAFKALWTLRPPVPPMIETPTKPKPSLYHSRLRNTLLLPVVFSALPPAAFSDQLLWMKQLHELVETKHTAGIEAVLMTPNWQLWIFDILSETPSNHGKWFWTTEEAFSADCDDAVATTCAELVSYALSFFAQALMHAFNHWSSSRFGLLLSSTLTALRKYTGIWDLKTLFVCRRLLLHLIGRAIAEINRINADVMGKAWQNCLHVLGVVVQFVLFTPSDVANQDSVNEVAQDNMQAPPDDVSPISHRQFLENFDSVLDYGSDNTEESPAWTNSLEGDLPVHLHIDHGRVRDATLVQAANALLKLMAENPVDLAALNSKQQNGMKLAARIQEFFQRVSDLMSEPALNSLCPEQEQQENALQAQLNEFMREATTRKTLQSWNRIIANPDQTLLQSPLLKVNKRGVGEPYYFQVTQKTLSYCEGSSFLLSKITQIPSHSVSVYDPWVDGPDGTNSILTEYKQSALNKGPCQDPKELHFAIWTPTVSFEVIPESEHLRTEWIAVLSHLRLRLFAGGGLHSLSHFTPATVCLGVPPPADLAAKPNRIVRANSVGVLKQALRSREPDPVTMVVPPGAPTFNRASSSEFAPVFKPKGFASNCELCQSKFSLLKRKIHCHSCGGVFCVSCLDKCVIPNMSLTEQKPVCLQCFPSLQKRSSAIRRLAST